MSGVAVFVTWVLALDTVLFFTRVRPSPDEMSNRTRVDVMIVYDLLGVLRCSGTF